MTRRPLQLLTLFAKVSVQNLAAYRFEAITRVIMTFVNLAAELVTVWTIFHNTPSLNGWRWQHVLILMGVFRLIAGGIRLSIVPNMRRILEDIREGTLDFVLLRPVDSQYLVSIREVVVWRVVDVAIGVVIALVGCYELVGRIPLGGLVRFTATLAGAFLIIYAVWLMLATLCFWFVRVQNIEMVFWNVFEAGRFPIDIYGPRVRFSLTWIIPLAFITTFPVGALVGDAAKTPAMMPPAAFAIAAVLLFASRRFWLYGLRHYSGASA